MKNILQEAMKVRDFSEDAAILTRAAKIIRKDIFEHDSNGFSGNFSSKCQEKSLPSSLKSLITMILNSPNLKEQDDAITQPCLTIGQIFIYNTKKSFDKLRNARRHSLEREKPLPVYIDLNTLSRCKKLIQQLFQLGISVSYDRVMELEEMIAKSSCELFKKENVVAPASLRNGVFTVGATQAALYQHVKRTLHQAGIWAICDQPWQDIPAPDSFGWKKRKIN